MEIFKSDEENKKKFIAKGLEYADNNEYEKSIREFGNALKLFPRDEDALFNLAFVYSDMRQFGAAYDIFKKLISINPHHIEAFNNLGLIFAGQERYNDAVLVYKKGIEQNPSSAALYNNLGNVYYDMGMFEQAVINFKKSGELDPVFLERLYHPGIDSYINGGNMDSAILKLQEAAKQNINRAKSVHDLGVAYMERRMFGKALEAFGRAILIDPNYLSARVNMGYIYQEKEDYENAIRSFERALILNPKSAKIYNTIGLIYDKIDRPDDAVKMYKKALALDSTYANSHYMLGRLYSNRGSVDKAVAEFTKHIRIYETGGLVEDAMRRIAELKSIGYGDVMELFSLYTEEPSGMSKAPEPAPAAGSPVGFIVPPAAPYKPAPKPPEGRETGGDYMELVKEKINEKNPGLEAETHGGPAAQSAGNMLSGAVPPHMIREEAVAMPLPMPEQAIEVIRDDSYGAEIIGLPSRPQEDSWEHADAEASMDPSTPSNEYTHNLSSGEDVKNFDSGPAPDEPADEVKKVRHPTFSAGYIPQEPVHSASINSVGPISPIGASTGGPISPRMPVSGHNTVHKTSNPAASSENGKDENGAEATEKEDEKK